MSSENDPRDDAPAEDLLDWSGGEVKLQSGASGGTEIEVSSGGVDESDLDIDVPAELPVLPLKNTVLFPLFAVTAIGEHTSFPEAGRRGAASPRPSLGLCSRQEGNGG